MPGVHAVVGDPPPPWVAAAPAAQVPVAQAALAVPAALVEIAAAGTVVPCPAEEEGVGDPETAVGAPGPGTDLVGAPVPETAGAVLGTAAPETGAVAGTVVGSPLGPRAARCPVRPTGPKQPHHT